MFIIYMSLLCYSPVVTSRSYFCAIIFIWFDFNLKLFQIFIFFSNFQYFVAEFWWKQRNYIQLIVSNKRFFRVRAISIHYIIQLKKSCHYVQFNKMLVNILQAYYAIKLHHFVQCAPRGWPAYIVILFWIYCFLSCNICRSCHLNVKAKLLRRISMLKNHRHSPPYDLNTGGFFSLSEGSYFSHSIVGLNCAGAPNFRSWLFKNVLISQNFF